MMSAFTPSRRKMFEKVRVTVDVPAPLEPLYGGDPDAGMIFARIKVQ